jgi:lysophospholipase L1-like esterase
MNSFNYIISLYISLWSAISYDYFDKIPRPKYTLEQEYRTFVRYNQNKIHTPYPQTTLKQFYLAMDDLIHKRQSKVNIIHFGDSHIQADFFSDQIRSHFNDEKLLGNGGRGYFFPCSMAQSQNPFNITVSYKGAWAGCKNVQLYKSCSWGLSGMTSSTKDSLAQFTIDPNTLSKNKYEINRVKVYYHVADPNSYNVKLITPSGAISPMRLDADGYAEFVLTEPQKKITFQLEKLLPNQKDFTLEGVSLENNAAGVQYHAVGVNSATVAHFLKTPKLEQHIRSLYPDLVIVSLGTNDAYSLYFDENQYKSQLAKLIQRIKQASPTTSIMITTPGDCALPGGVINKSNLKAVKVIMELAEETDCAVWDLFTVMGGLGSVNSWLAQNMTAADRVHLSGKGYRLQGDLLYDALIQNYADYCFKRLEEK